MRALLLGDSQLARLVRYPFAMSSASVNRAVGGAISTEVASQIGDLDLTDFDVVLLGVGTNDAGTRPVPLDEFTTAVSAVVERAGRTPVVFVASPGADSRATADYDDARMATYAAAARVAVESAGGAYIDTPRLLRPLGRAGRTPDGVHVAKAAHLLYIPALRLAARRAVRNARKLR